MLRNYLKIVLRNMQRYKGYTFINLTGLAIGMACCILIIAYIATELSYDKYHGNAPRIYRLYSELTLGGTPNMIATTNNPPALALRDDFPEVIEAARFRPVGKVPVKYEDRQFYESRVFYADASVFNVFTLPFIHGDSETALTTANTIVITADMAKKYFGDANPVGKVLRFIEKTDFVIDGVIENVPPNSHFTFDILCSMETLYVQNKQQMDSWLSSFINFSYVLLQDDYDYRELEKKLPSIVEKYIGDGYEQYGVAVKYFLQPLTSIHLHSHLRHEITTNSDIAYVYIFAASALFILLIACINFMNLSTARSAGRAREIGIRKVFGSDRFSLIRQFYGESFLYCLIALVIALVIVKLTLPFFSTVTGRDLEAGYGQIPWLIPALAGFLLIVSLAAGSYPALFLSGFKPARILKGKMAAGAANSHFRKVLVVVQFAVSISLIIGTAVIIQQLSYMKNKNLGFDKEQVVYLPVTDKNFVETIDSFKEALSGYSGVVSVGIGSHIPGWESSGATFKAEGFAEDQTIMMNAMDIDHDYIPTLGIEMVQGRNFSPDYPSDRTESIIVNETAVREIGWDDPIGRQIGFAAGDMTGRIIGVARDFHYRPAHTRIEPLYISNNLGRIRAVVVRIRPEDIAGSIKFLERKWKEFNPGRPFEYSFLDESFDRHYRAEEKLRGLLSYFTLFAIFIACLGLFGLASYSAEQRTKEIGIRKVLGATIPNITLMLTKEFSRWILLANCIAWPVAWYFLNGWLRNFAYRVDIGWEVFIAAGVLSFVIAVLTVNIQAVKAARANPVESLKYE